MATRKLKMFLLNSAGLGYWDLFLNVGELHSESGFGEEEFLVPFFVIFLRRRTD